MRRPKALPMLALVVLSASAAASVWATEVGPRPLERSTHVQAAQERIDPYQARFGRKRPVIAIVGENGATELTDFVIPYGILARADVAELVTVSTKPGVMTMRPALHLLTDTTTAGFDERYPEGADYVIVPMVVKSDDRTLLDWIRRQDARGATIMSICDGALVVANSRLMKGRRGTAHWATLDYRRKKYPEVTWVENSRYVADGRVVSSAGISASVPAALALVEAIAGKEKAGAVAHDIAVADWSSQHDSQIFAPSFGRNLTALATTRAINKGVHREEAIGVPISAGFDEIALAITADAYSRTGRSKAYALASAAQPVRSSQGLTFLPDRTAGGTIAVDRVVAMSDAKPGKQMDAALALVQQDYGRLTAYGVALQFEYPDFK